MHLAALEGVIDGMVEQATVDALETMQRVSEEMQELDAAARGYGPSFPIALCKCGARLHFGRHDYRPEWQCWCPDCVDGDYDQETGRTVATYPIGDGKTLADALDDYAIRCDVETESLFAKEGM